MEKQTQRGNLPISYDLRIRNDRPFQTKDNSRDYSKEKITKTESNDIIKIDKIKYKYNSDESKNFRKANVKNYIDFSKKLSREQYDNLFKDKEVVPFTIPNYSQVEPRCLTMVSYSSKINKKKIKKKFKKIPGIKSTFSHHKFRKSFIKRKSLQKKPKRRRNTSIFFSQIYFSRAKIFNDGIIQ